MSFLFGRKEKEKKAPGREIGAPSPALPIARENQKLAAGAPQPNPGSSVNNSLNSVSSSQVRNGLDPNQQISSRPGTSSGPATVPNANLYPWSQRQLTFSASQPSPFPRYGAAVNAVSSKEGDIYVMGGLVNGQTVKGDLWMVEAGSGSLNCYSVRTEAEGPGPRVGHASLLVGNAYIVFGGDTKQDENDPLDDTLYLLNTSTKQWSRALPPGPRPAGRYGHTLNILGSKLYVFGGQVDGHFFNDILAFDLNQLQSPTNRWELLVPDSSDERATSNPVPLGRTNHSVIAWNDKLFLFGGTDGVQWFNDVWTYDPRSNMWDQLDCIGYIPQPREGHSAALVNDVMYIFGGRTQEGDDLGDLAAFRITSRRWYTFQNMGPAPSPRSGHSMTAFDKQIVVLAGEPSSIQRDPNELSLVYLLDTAKIRYPDDQQIQQTPAGERVAGNRRPSTDRPSTDRNVGNRGMAPREATTGGTPPASRLPRAASVSQPSPGPPPQQLAPAPRTNVSAIPGSGAPRTRTPTKDPRGYVPSSEVSRGPSFERPEVRPEPAPTTSEVPRAPASRSLSPATTTRQPQSSSPPQVNDNYVQEQEPASFSGVVRNQSQSRQVRAPESLVNKEISQVDEPQYKTPAMQDGSGPSKSTMLGATTSANATSGQQVASLMKEIEALKNSNAYYMSELAGARKAGYSPSGNQSSNLDATARSFGGNQNQVTDQLMAMKATFAQIQSTNGTRLEVLVKKIAEVEQERAAAVRDAANARAQLAAQIESPSASPRLGSGPRDLDESENSQVVSRKLAAAYARHSELEAKLTALDAQFVSERKAREIAETNAEAAHKRALELDQGQNPAEVESIRAALFEAQKEARESASQLNDAQAKAEMLEIDNEDFKRQLEESTGRLADHGTMFTSLREAVSSSDEKYALLDRKLQQEREEKESVQTKLSQLRTEHEERTAELETTSRRLRDAEELAEKHAGEAQKHRDVVLAGLDKLNTRPADNSQIATSERKIATLQQQVKDAHSLVMKSHAEAEEASEKLRSAEERIAGLEAYQQQASRESLDIRKQLTEAIRTAQNWQSQSRDLRSKLESQQRDASALGVQHGALKDIIEERSASVTRSLDSPSGARSPDTARLRELEQALEDSRKAHEETKSSFEIAQQGSEKVYREKLELLEQDYQSAVSYVKGTEKMLKRMKDELTKSKSQNNRLQADLEKVRAGGSASPAGWENERQALQQEIEKMQESVKTSIFQLENQMSEVRGELQNTQHQRDELRNQNEQLAIITRQTQAEMEKLRNENSTLEVRATDAEEKVTTLLNHMEHSVDTYRRQSQMQLNGAASHHTREPSNTSTYTGGTNHSHSNSIGGESFSTTGLDRNSMALDNLASELENLRTQWEGTHRTYRLSNNFDFEREPANGSGGGLSTSLASWRKRLEAEERDREGSPNMGSSASAMRPSAGRGVPDI